MELLLETVLYVLIPVCELMGVTVVAVSTLAAFFRYLRFLFTRRGTDVKFRLAAGLALSLEFKMAAEILKTVLIRQLSELVMLGAVILLRSVLSVLIHWEMRGGPSPQSHTEVHVP